MYKIIEITPDLANKFRVRVIVNEYSTQFFKFDHYPTQEEVDEVVENFLQFHKPDDGGIT
jgi:hypothetical protein